MQFLLGLICGLFAGLFLYDWIGGCGGYGNPEDKERTAEWESKKIRSNDALSQVRFPHL